MKPRRKQTGHALRAASTVEDDFQLTTGDRWFLTQIKETVDLEDELLGG